MHLFIVIFLLNYRYPAVKIVYCFIVILLFDGCFLVGTGFVWGDGFIIAGNYFNWIIEWVGCIEFHVSYFWLDSQIREFGCTVLIRLLMTFSYVYNRLNL